MGYRSDVVMLLYGKEEVFPILKLWVEENLIPVIKEHGVDNTDGGRKMLFDNGDNTDGQDGLWLFTRGVYKGYVYKECGTKWYPDYPEIQAFEAGRDKFAEVFNRDNHAVELAMEFMRVGEEPNDIESIDSFRSVGLLSVQRDIVY
jgi:hypothetical protein